MEISGWGIMLIAVLCLMVGYAIGQTVGVMRMFVMMRQNMKSVVRTVILEMKVQDELEKVYKNAKST